MKKMNKVTLAIMAAGLLCVGLMFGADASAADTRRMRRRYREVLPEHRTRHDPAHGVP